MENKWYHFGKWIEPVLTSSLWLRIINSQVYKELKFNFITVTKSLDYSYFFLKDELNEVSCFIEKEITGDKKWFDKLFSVCDRIAEQLLALEGKKDINNG